MRNSKLKHPQADRQVSTIPSKLIHLLNERQVAEILGVSVATVRRWRLLGQGPLFIKIGVLVRYHPESVCLFLAGRRTGGEQPVEAK